MIATYDPVERYTGNGAESEYTFDFKIQNASEFMAVVLNASDVEVQRVRGDDLTTNLVDDSATTFFDSLDFDELAGGGTLTLSAVLTSGYKISLILAPDEPAQDTSLKRVFSTAIIETVLDHIAAFVQRAFWLASRSIRINDADPGTGFDPQLPYPLEAESTIIVSADGLGFEQGPTVDELLQASADVTAAEAARDAALAAQAAALAAQAAAETAETNAETAETNAETAETNAAASAAAAAFSALSAATAGFVATGPFACNQNASTALTAETTDSATYTQVDYRMRIVRGTTVFGLAKFSIFYRNGAWELVSENDLYAVTALGVTFTVDATTAQITAVVDNSGAGNATITAKKLRWAA